MIAFTAAAVAIVVVMYFVHQEYEATCGLAYGHDADGEIHYAFENDGNSTAIDQLFAMRKIWLSPGFRSRVYKRVRAECANAPTNDIIKAISSAELEIRARKVSVLVRVTASSQSLANACAKAFSKEIADTTAAQGQECKKKGVAQLKRNCEKQERYITSLREKLCQMRGKNVKESELKEAEDRLVSQERILAAMIADVSKFQAEDSWCGFFVEMNDDGEVANTQ
jgi:hypothetical protein